MVPCGEIVGMAARENLEDADSCSESVVICGIISKHTL